MIPAESGQPEAIESRTWFARNWVWCVPAGLLLTIVWAWLMFRPTLHPGYIEDDKKEAAEAIARLHSLVTTGQFDQIYQDADSSLKNAQTKEALTLAMQGTRNKYGAFRQVTFSQLNVIVGNPVQVRAVYNSTYEKGETTELFTFVRRGDNLRLAYYSISPGTVKLEDHSANLEVAKKAADQIYTYVASQDYGPIWDQAHDDFKNSASREQLILALTQRNQQLGVCSPPALADTDFVDNDSGHFVGLIYHRKCEHGEIDERLAWKIVDGKALLRGYH